MSTDAFSYHNIFEKNWEKNRDAYKLRTNERLRGSDGALPVPRPFVLEVTILLNVLWNQKENI